MKDILIKINTKETGPVEEEEEDMKKEWITNETLENKGEREKILDKHALKYRQMNNVMGRLIRTAKEFWMRNICEKKENCRKNTITFKFIVK